MASLKYMVLFIGLLPICSVAQTQTYTHYDDHHEEQHHKPEQHTESDDLEDTGENGNRYHRQISKDSLSRLKAVIISADVDGIKGEHTRQFAERMKEAAFFLKGKGLQVHEFFSPDDNWEKIVAAASGAHIIIYSGHGVYDGKIPPVWVGGFSLTNRFVSSKQIQDELKLAPDAVVIFNQACFTAGSAAGDEGDIGANEAHRRVAIYAHPFIDMGVACYYANNFYNSSIAFLDLLFYKKPVKSIYNEEATSWSQILEEKPYDFNSNYIIGISKYGEDAYSIAYVGKPNFTVSDWFRSGKR